MDCLGEAHIPVLSMCAACAEAITAQCWLQDLHAEHTPVLSICAVCAEAMTAQCWLPWQVPIPTSLLKLPTEHSTRAVKMFAGLLKYCGDAGEAPSTPQVAACMRLAATGYLNINAQANADSCVSFVCTRCVTASVRLLACMLLNQHL